MAQLQPGPQQGMTTGPQSLQRSYAHEIELPVNKNAAIYESCVNTCGAVIGFWGMFPFCK
jgi:hypothetical protein